MDIQAYIDKLENERRSIRDQIESLSIQDTVLSSDIENAKNLRLKMAEKLGVKDELLELRNKLQGKDKKECFEILAKESADKTISLTDLAQTLIKAGIYDADILAVENRIGAMINPEKTKWQSLGNKMYQYIGD